MASSDSDRRTGGRRPENDDPTTDVPEADAAEQRAPAGSCEPGDWTEGAARGTFDEADEADVIEQSIEAGEEDEEERR